MIEGKIISMATEASTMTALHNIHPAIYMNLMNNTVNAPTQAYKETVTKQAQGQGEGIKAILTNQGTAQGTVNRGNLNVVGSVVKMR